MLIKEPHRSHKEQWPTDISLIQSVLQYKHDRKLMFKFGCYKLFGYWGNVSNILSYFHFFPIISSSKGRLAFNLSKLKNALPIKHTICQVWLKLTQFFCWRWKCEEFTTTTTVTDKVGEKSAWMFVSGKLNVYFFAMTQRHIMS